MAEILVKNSLNPNKAVKFNIALKKLVLKGSYYGEPQYVIEIGTTHDSFIGEASLVKYAYNIVGESNLDDVLENILAELCSNINWETLLEDKYPPQVVSGYPSGSNVSILSNVIMSISDLLPTSGIDLSDMKVTFNNGVLDFDITSSVTIEGSANERKLTWKPDYRILHTYGD